MKGKFKKIVAGTLTFLLLTNLGTVWAKSNSQDIPNHSNVQIAEQDNEEQSNKEQQDNNSQQNDETTQDNVEKPNNNNNIQNNINLPQPEQSQNDINNLNVNTIFERYYNGEENAEDLINLRKAIVEKNHWQNFVDENYFLLDSFYSNKSGAELSTFDIGVSTKPTFNINSDNYDEVDSITTPYANVGNGFPVGTIGTNTQTSQKVGWDASGWNAPTYTNIFYTSFNGIQIYPGFCGAHDLPGQYDRGQQFRIAGTSNNIMVRKAVYYGYGGADGRLRNKYSSGNNQSPFAVYTALTISDYMGRNPVIYSQKPNAYTKLKEFINDLNSLPAPPSHFKAYVAEPLLAGHQPLVFLGVEKPPIKYGYVKLEKGSTDPQLTNGNDCYSLKGAEYTFYKDKSCTQKVVTLVTNEKGHTPVTKLSTGTYYMKETKAPKGFAKDPKIRKIDIFANHTSTSPNLLKVKDIPKMDPVGVLLRKVDSKTKQSRASVKTATLEGAEFTFKFYKGNYETDPALQGQKPVRQWVFKTNENGYCDYSEEYLVSGDELFKDQLGTPSFPIGTITIQETKSPEGFLINNQVFLVNIKENGNSGNVYPYVEPVIPENLFSLKLIKKQANKDIIIPNAVFEHTSPKGVKTDYITNSNGQLSIEGLQYGIHTIKEKTAPTGYLPNPAEVKFKVNQDNSIEILSNTSTDETGKITINSDNPNDFNMIVEDKVIPPNLKIIKENNKGQLLQGAEFTLFSDEACTQIVDKAASDSKGEIQFNNIDIDRDYWLMETVAPNGYKLPVDKDKNFIKYKIKFESIPIQNKFNFIVNDKVYNTTTSNDMFFVRNNIGVMKIVNNIGVELPKTGSDRANTIFIISTFLMLTGLILFYKRSKKNEN